MSQHRFESAELLIIDGQQLEDGNQPGAGPDQQELEL